MLDLSPEKLMVVLAVALMALGPNRLPAAARTLARGLASARELTTSIADPIRKSLAEPNRVMNGVVTDLRDAIGDADPHGHPASPSTPLDPTLN